MSAPPIGRVIRMPKSERDAEEDMIQFATESTGVTPSSVTKTIQPPTAERGKEDQAVQNPLALDPQAACL